MTSSPTRPGGPPGGAPPRTDATARVAVWRALARQLRVDAIRTSTAAGSGHPTSALSAADLMAVLLDKYLRYDFTRPDDPANDRLIFSKGHASGLLYAMYKAAGAITDAELMTYRRRGSRMEGHPTPVLPWVDVATGSLGQGLPIAVGVALAGKYLDRLPYRVWVLCGDSEMAEGSMWEAFEKGAYYGLSNLAAILDMNRLGQRGATAWGWDGEVYAARARAFGWHVVAVDGHDLDAIDRAFAEAVAPRGAPALVIARTVKGRGVSFLEDREGWHGKPLSPEQAAKALAELGGEGSIRVRVAAPRATANGAAAQGSPGPAGAAPGAGDAPPSRAPLKLPAYDPGTQVATRQAYGDALKALGAARPDVVVLDAEVSNSTFAEVFRDAHPGRFFEMFIAEQQMVAAAVGLAVRGYVPFASSFAAFLSRAYDFIRMAAVSRADIRLCGSHAGVSIGPDGPSQMGLEDLAMMRAVHGSTVLYPCDPNQTAALVAAMADLPGISYLRTTREKTPVIYPPGEAFPIGGSRVLRQSDADRVTVVAAGITLHEALAACDALQAEGIAVRLIDAYSVKPVDAATLRDAVRATGGRLVVAEDHWAEGGLGSAVLEALAGATGGATAGAGGVPGADLPPLRFIHLAVREMPGSASPQEQLDAHGLSARHIADAVRRLAG